jgi:hypothetical protein
MIKHYDMQPPQVIRLKVCKEFTDECWNCRLLGTKGCIRKTLDLREFK